MNYTTSMPDWEKRITRRQSIIQKPLFPDTAEQALKIFKSLKIPDLAGKPTFGEASEEWIFDLVRAIFGFYDKETGKQLVREYLILVSKKNTKSTVAAGIMLTALIMNWRENEEHLIIAPTKEIADNSYKPASSMIKADPFLKEMFHTRDHIRTIEHKTKKNTLKVVSAENDALSGKKAGWVLVDELWVFGSKAKADGMLMEATGGQVSRDEGRTIYLTTQSDEPPAGVFKEKLNYMRDVRDGKVIDDSSMPILYEFPENYIKNKLYLKPENFFITNPNINRSVNPDWIERELEKALKKTDNSKQKFLAKHLNIEIDFALRNDNWAGAEYWVKASRDFDLDYIIKNSEVITIGIDGGGLDDLLGLYVLGRDVDNNWLGYGKAWVSRTALERRQEIAPKLHDFNLDGDVVIVEDVGEDLDELIELIVKIDNTDLLDKIGCDPAGIGDILDGLELAGIDKDKIVGVSQGWRLGGAIKTTERRLADGSLTVSNQNLMKWCVSNAKVEQRANSILITKQSSGTGKIDPLMAMFGAVYLMALNPESKGGLNFVLDPIIG